MNTLNPFHYYTTSLGNVSNQNLKRKKIMFTSKVGYPMGGGEGRASGGHPRSRKGLIAKGYKTRKKSNPSNKYILERRKK